MAQKKRPRANLKAKGRVSPQFPAHLAPTAEAWRDEKRGQVARSHGGPGALPLRERLHAGTERAVPHLDTVDSSGESRKRERLDCMVIRAHTPLRLAASSDQPGQETP